MNFIVLFINKTRVVAFSFIYYVHSLIYIFIRQLNEKEFIIFAIIVAIMALGLTGCDDKKAQNRNAPACQ